MRSREGQLDLVAFANVRVVLLQLASTAKADAPDHALARDLQCSVRAFAQLLEVDGNNPEPKARLWVVGYDQTHPAMRQAASGASEPDVLARIEDHVAHRIRHHRVRRTGRSRRRPDGAVQSGQALGA